MNSSPQSRHTGKEREQVQGEDDANGDRPQIGSSYILNIIVCIFTFIAVAYLTLSVIFLPKWYNMWAALGLEIFMTIMWLSAFSNLASASVNMIFISSLDYYYYYKKRDLERRSLPGYVSSPVDIPL